MPEDKRLPFSRRHGYQPSDPAITVREDAPEGLRATLLELAAGAGLNENTTRTIVCRVLRVLPDRNNWSAPNVWGEVEDLVRSCDWPKVDDLAEALYEHLSMHAPGACERFETGLNAYFREAGIGWQLRGGEIRTRGAEAFEAAVQAATAELEARGKTTAGSEVHEALRDLSRRPNPDLTGAIQHAMAALECVAREASNAPTLTLGQILQRHPGLIPPPLDVAVEKAWGFASEMGRHLREGRTPGRADVELVVGVAACVATYLANQFRERPRGGLTR
jgi:hypothetical protein